MMMGVRQIRKPRSMTQMQKTIRTVLLIAITACPILGQDKSLLITGGQRFRTSKGDVVPNAGIVIEDRRFKSIDGAQSPADIETLKLNDDQFILPGFIDLHAHYNVRLLKIRREEFRVMPTVYLANGVTVTFSAGEYDPDGMLQLRKRIESGEQIGPRLLNSGPYFGRVRRGWRNITNEQIRKDVDTWAERGVGGFKAKAIGPEHLKVLVDQAHKHGLTVTGHLDSGYRGSVNPRDAIEMGIDRIEHFLGGDAMPATKSAYASLANITTDMPEFKKQVQLFIDRGTYFDCTITAYGYFGKRGDEYDYWIDEREFFTPFIQGHREQTQAASDDAVRRNLQSKTQNDRRIPQSRWQDHARNGPLQQRIVPARIWLPPRTRRPGPSRHFTRRCDPNRNHQRGKGHEDRQGSRLNQSRKGCGPVHRHRGVHWRTFATRET